MDVRHPHQEVLRGNDSAYLGRLILLTPHFPYLRSSTATVCSEYLPFDCWHPIDSFSRTHRESQPSRKSTSISNAQLFHPVTVGIMVLGVLTWNLR
jgi:hypothetical protein